MKDGGLYLSEREFPNFSRLRLTDDGKLAFLLFVPFLSDFFLILTVLKNHGVDVVAAKDAPPEDRLFFRAVVIFQKHGTSATGAFHREVPE